MSSRQIVAGFLALSVLMSSPAFTWRADGQAAPPFRPERRRPLNRGSRRRSHRLASATFTAKCRSGGRAPRTGPRRGSTRPGARRRPLFGFGGNVEIQVGPRAFVRAAEETQMGLDNQEPDFSSSV